MGVVWRDNRKMMHKHETAQGVSGENSTPDDALTLIAIGILAYIFGDMLHEAAGHGVACIAAGGKALMLTTVNFQCSEMRRSMVAAGTLVNLAAGIILWIVLRWWRGASVHMRFFLWLSMAFNLLNGGAYFAYSGVTNTGDLAFVINGFQPAWLWRTALVLLGGFLYYLSMWIVAKEMRPFLGSDESAWSRRARQLTLIPYFAAGVAACVGALLNPIGIVLVATAAGASSFGSGFGLIGIPRLLRNSRISNVPKEPPARLTRNFRWVLTAAVIFFIFVAVIGPGVRFHGNA